jgi:uncharacterized membrane protein YqiK
MITTLEWVLFIAGGSVGALVVLGTAVSRFYRRCSADEALVRTGAGGTRVYIGAGAFVLPAVHQLMRVSLKSIKLTVERSGKQHALVTADKIKANVTTELYVKVEPLQDSVRAAARSFGSNNLDQHVVAELIEGKLTDALRSSAANKTFNVLHTNRQDFADSIKKTLADDLKHNGLILENVSITSFGRLPVSQLDPNDVFQEASGRRDLVGLPGVVVTGQVDEHFGEVRVKLLEGDFAQVSCRVLPGEKPIGKDEPVVFVKYDREDDRLYVAPLPPEPTEAQSLPARAHVGGAS